MVSQHFYKVASPLDLKDSITRVWGSGFGRQGVAFRDPAPDLVLPPVSAVWRVSFLRGALLRRT